MRGFAIGRRDVEPDLAGGMLDQLGELLQREQLGELVEDAVLARVRGVGGRDPDTLQRVDDVEVPARLPPLAVDGERVADNRLHAKRLSAVPNISS